MSIYKPADSPYSHLTWIPTGFHSLDKTLGGGVPTRKIFEISGNFSVGKSTLALHIVSQAQKLGMPCLWIDSEFSFSEEYAQKVGVDTNNIEILTAEYAEAILDETEEWARKHKNSFIVLDSIGSLLPREQAEKDSSGRTIGGQAKLIAVFCRKIAVVLAINNIALVVLNHQFIDIMTGKIKTSGGAKLEYSKAVWLMLRKSNKRVMSGEAQVGDVIETEVRKHKLSNTNHQKTELTLIYGEGFSAEADLLQELIDKGEVIKKGNTFWRGSEKLGVGLKKAREALKV